MRPSIRTATIADYPAIARLFGELEGDPTPTFARWATDLMPHTLVAEHAGDVRGYVSFSQLGELGHVRNLVVAREARNTGLGRTLMDASAAALRAAGATEWHLNVHADNAAAIHLYEKLGLRAEHRSTAVRLRWRDIAALPAELATPLPVAPVEDDDIERAFGLPAGRIEMARLANRELVQLRDRDCAVSGFAAFDAELAGASPFHVARVPLAATLLSQLRAHAHHDHVTIVADDDPALADALVAAGADVRLRLVHYSGPLTTATLRCA